MCVFVCVCVCVCVPQLDRSRCVCVCVGRQQSGHELETSVLLIEYRSKAGSKLYCFTALLFYSLLYCQCLRPALTTVQRKEEGLTKMKIKKGMHIKKNRPALTAVLLKEKKASLHSASCSRIKKKHKKKQGNTHS